MDKTLEQQIRLRTLQAQRKMTAEIHAHNRRLQEIERQRKENAAKNVATSDGITPNLREQLIAAEQKLKDNPKHQEMIEKAQLKHKVEQTRKSIGMDDAKPAPETEMGRQLPRPEPVPEVESVGDRRKNKKQQGQ